MTTIFPLGRLTLALGRIEDQPDCDTVVIASPSVPWNGPEIIETFPSWDGHEARREILPYQFLVHGQAVMTPAFGRPNKCAIYAKAPHYLLDPDPQRLLAETVRTVLALAVANWSLRIAFPELSAGTLHFPVEEAAPIMVREILDHLKSPEIFIEEVRVVVESQGAFDVFKATIGEHLQAEPPHGWSTPQRA